MNIAEKQVYEVLKRNRKVMSTIQIATRVYLSVDQTLRYLKRLEAQGLIERVGNKRGWFVPAEDHK